MSEANIQVVRDAYANFQSGNIEAILGVLAANVEWIDPGEPGVPYAGKYYGPQEVRRFFEKMAETTEVASFEPQHYFASGDQVAAFGHWTARSKATGRQFASPWAMRFTVRNGKIARFEAYTDTQATANAYRTGVMGAG